MLLAIDAGNTQLKMAVFKNDRLEESTVIAYENSDFDSKLKHWLSKDIQTIGLVSVKEYNLTEKIISFSKSNVSLVDMTFNFPFKINYTSPETLGIDRIVACAGAYALNKQQGSLLVIDAGTCITYDVVNDKKQHEGGAISPGITIRSKSLNRYTAKLPPVEITQKEIDTIGKNTKEAITSGILNGVQYEAQGFIQHIKLKYPDLKVFLTGGDAFFFEDALKSSIFAEENLVLIGINELMKINA
ncbi:MAG: type III pantothenate kinase [Saprospiraceae bacterium]|jgi:type III pantothenate kinase